MTWYNDGGITMKRWKRILPFGVASLMLAATPLQALAASPEFSRTAEEWARLQDDHIDYDELADLVHEYNATVQKNRIDLNEFRKEYGDTNEKWANRYRELANEIQNNISYPDSDDAGYASAMMAIISDESNIDTLRENADEAVDDLLIKSLTYQLAEATLVSVAQSNMISYYRNQVQQQVDQAKQSLLQETYQSVVTKKNNGMATEVDVLTAQENLRSMDQALQSNASSIENARQKLQVMLGWKFDASPEIGALPSVDMAVITAMNPAEDKAAALDNNYTLKMNKRKRENAKYQDTIETLDKTIKENEQNIGAALSSSYQSVLAAKTSYDLAVAQAQLEQQNFQSAERKYSVGNISRLDYLSQKNTTETAQLNVRIAEMSLLQAVQNYQWAVNGLANAS